MSSQDINTVQIKVDGKTYNIKASREFITYMSAALQRISQGKRISTIRLIEAYLQSVHDLYLIEMGV